MSICSIDLCRNFIFLAPDWLEINCWIDGGESVRQHCVLLADQHIDCRSTAAVLWSGRLNPRERKRCALSLHVSATGPSECSSVCMACYGTTETPPAGHLTRHSNSISMLDDDHYIFGHGPALEQQHRIKPLRHTTTSRTRTNLTVRHGRRVQESGGHRRVHIFLYPRTSLVEVATT